MFVIYIIITMFFTWYIKNQKIFEKIFFNNFLKEIRQCWFCLGFWVCFIFYWFFKINVLDFLNLENNILNAIISCVITSVVVSSLNYYLIEGIKKNHTINYIK